jgi:hypothetical protein
MMLELVIVWLTEETKEVRRPDHKKLEIFDRALRLKWL